MNRILITLVFTMITGLCLGQENNILSDKSNYEYLIGQTFSDVKELDGFVFGGRLSKTDKGGRETCSTVLLNDDVQIYTSEISYYNNYKKKIYEIVDVIVLNGKYSSCEDCYESGKKNVTIKTIHHRDDRKKEHILLAFEKNDDTGNYRQITADGLFRNPNTDKLIKY